MLNILCFDGGGIRGIYSAHIIKRIQESFHTVFHEKFDLIAGTSTGSIIASSLVIDFPIENIIKMYSEQGRKIFSKNLFSLGGLIREKYNNSFLSKILKEVFQDNKLKDCKTGLVIPATDIGNASVHVFKSTYSSDFIRDPERLIRDAVLASCSAPLYFSPIIVDDSRAWRHR